MDYSTFVSIVEKFTSVDNQLRGSAVDAFEKLKAENPENALQLILQCLKTEGNDQSRLQCALLIRNIFRKFHYERDGHSFWFKLNSSLQNQLKKILLSCLQEETHKVTRSNISDAISNLAIKLIPMQQWPELFPILQKMVMEGNAIHQHSALKTLGVLSSIYSSELSAGRPSYAVKIVNNCMLSQEVTVRVECLGFIANIVENGERKLYKALFNIIPAIIETLLRMCQINHEETIECLRYLVRIVDADAMFFKAHGDMVCEQICSIAKNEAFDEEVRVMAAEIMMCIAENKPKFAMKIRDFIPKLMDVLMTFMLDIKNEKYSNWLETGEDDDDDEGLYHVGEEGFDRLAKAFEGESEAKVIEIIFNGLGKFLNHSEWYYRFVGIMIISQTAEYLPQESQMQRLDDIMKVVLTQLQDQDARVRFASCQAIGQVALDHQAYVQENYHKTGFPSLINAMNDVSPTVQSHAMAAFINFTEEVEKSSLLPYVNFVMEHLLTRITLQTPCLVREQAISAIAVIAGVLEADFMNYYATVVPAIMSIIASCTSKEERNCRGKGIECISIIGISVGKEHFFADSGPLMGALLQISSGGFEDDDPVKEYLQQAIIRMCQLMNEHFVPYLPQLVPSLLAVLATQPQVVAGEEAENANEDMTMVLLREKALALKTSLLQDQKHALDLIGTFAKVLGEKFRDHIQPCTEALLPLLSFILSDDIKQEALSTMAILIGAAKSVSELTGDKTMLHAMITNTASKVFTNLDDVKDVDYYDGEAQSLVAESTGLNECLQEAGPGVLSESLVLAYGNKVFDLVRQSQERSAQLEAEEDEYDSDDEERDETMQEMIEQEEALRRSLLEILGSLMLHHKQEFMNTLFNPCKEFIANYSSRNAKAEDRALAVYVSIDLFAHFGELTVQVWGSIFPFLLPCIGEEDPRVRQAACYAMTHACKISQFESFANEVAARLLDAAKKDRDEQPMNASATDNAVAALGDCVNFHYNSIKGADMYLEYWLNYLPLKEDEVEGLRVHTDLMNFVMKQDARILGKDNCNLQKIVTIFLDVYGTHLSSDTLNDNIRLLLQQLGDPFMNTLLPMLSAEKKKQVERIARDIQVKQGNAM